MFPDFVRNSASTAAGLAMTGTKKVYRYLNANHYQLNTDVMQCGPCENKYFRESVQSKQLSALRRDYLHAVRDNATKIMM